MGEMILLCNLSTNAHDWRYKKSRKVIVAGLSNSAVAVGRLVAESR